MGSSGSGRISDYPGSSGAGGAGGGGAGGTGGGSGGGQPDDRCGRAFSVLFEDVEHSDYYTAHGATPPAGEELRIKLRKRLVAETTAGQSVGNLPTTLNYLAACLKEGWTYTGTVTDSSKSSPVATVAGDFAASFI